MAYNTPSKGEKLIFSYFLSFHPAESFTPDEPRIYPPEYAYTSYTRVCLSWALGGSADADTRSSAANANVVRTGVTSSRMTGSSDPTTPYRTILVPGPRISNGEWLVLYAQAPGEVPRGGPPFVWGTVLPRERGRERRGDVWATLEHTVKKG